MHSHSQPLGISRLLVLLLSTVHLCSAQITVYHQIPFGEESAASAASVAATASTSAGASAYTGLPAYNPVTLQPPAPPGSSGLPTNFPMQLSKAVINGASIPQSGAFFGFSVEMSVANQVLGKNSLTLQVPFLNLMANLVSRGGYVQVRVGGNTQETATLVANTTDGRILEKDKSAVSNPTDTPPLVFTPDLLYMMGNISALVNVRWHLGVPFNDTNNLRLAIVEQGEAILGDKLIGMQAGNEPDLYGKHLHRAPTYAPTDYFGEFGTMVNAINADTSIPVKKLLIGPSISSSNPPTWTPQTVWDTGFIDVYTNNLAALSVEHYPSDNCAVAFPNAGLGAPQDPQVLFPQYLSHTSAVNNMGQYISSTQLAQQKGKPFLMFETNTASCGGFPGLSDSFGAALWGVDWAMYMAAVNFTGALFHIGGQSVAYNPFNPPPTNQSTFHEWTIGPIYYSSLMVTEAIGPSNTTQVFDMGANNDNPLSPGYAIWENGKLARVLLINFASDPSGASDLSVDLSFDDGSAMPSTVTVKYLQASSVAQKGNFSWAGQTFGGNFGSDGRPQGTEVVQTVTCGPNAGGANVCTIIVPAPAAALVFLNSAATPDTAGGPTTTFPTTAITKSRNTLGQLSPSSVALSNGHSGSDGIVQKLGSTSQGSIPKSGAQSRMTRVGGVVATAVGLLAGWAVLAVF